MLKPPAENLGKYLRNCRERRKLSQSDVAKELNYSTPQFVSNWERGLSAPPSDTLRTLVGLYEIPKEEITEFLVKEQMNLLNSVFEFDPATEKTI